MEKEENFVRKIRKAAGMNQADFARAIGRSLQMLQLYERSQAEPPPDVLAKIEALAQGADIPASRFVPRPASPPPVRTAATRDGSITPAARQRYHEILDEIFDSGDPDAIRAVVPNIELFGKWVRTRSVENPRKKRETSR